ncbi:MAG: exodeoxyribonuclease VII small subunit [Candidatus Aminicenantes bacterium]|nr:exodeoxyribonuclease VII small subunit [Candidatus Aminicenantes bacterium]
MATLSFEKALEDLEKIVEKLEKAGLSLSESLTLFEKGVKLARFLRDELEKAEKKVEILLKDEKGEVKAKPFELGKEEAPSKENKQEEEEEEEEEESSDSGKDEDLPF